MNITSITKYWIPDQMPHVVECSVDMLTSYYTAVLCRNTAQPGKRSPKFRRKLLSPSSSTVKQQVSTTQLIPTRQHGVITHKTVTDISIGVKTSIIDLMWFSYMLNSFTSRPRSARVCLQSPWDGCHSFTTALSPTFLTHGSAEATSLILKLLRRKYRTQLTAVTVPFHFYARSHNSEKRLLASYPSVHPSVRIEKLGSHWNDFDEIWYLSFFENLSRKFKFY